MQHGHRIACPCNPWLHIHPVQSVPIKVRAITSNPRRVVPFALVSCTAEHVGRKDEKLVLVTHQMHGRGREVLRKPRRCYVARERPVRWRRRGAVGWRWLVRTYPWFPYSIDVHSWAAMGGTGLHGGLIHHQEYRPLRCDTFEHGVHRVLPSLQVFRQPSLLCKFVHINSLPSEFWKAHATKLSYCCFHLAPSGFCPSGNHIPHKSLAITSEGVPSFLSDRRKAVPISGLRH